MDAVGLELFCKKLLNSSLILVRAHDAVWQCFGIHVSLWF